MSISSRIIINLFTKGDNVRDAGLTQPDDVIAFNDIVYGDDPVWQSLNVYRPKNPDQQKHSDISQNEHASSETTAQQPKASETSAPLTKLPVIVSVHGGAWVYGDKERYSFYCMNLAQRGFAVVDFSYRLAPKSKYPAQLEDTASVFAWTLAHADKYGFDTHNLFAVGDSAGGHLLSLYCCLCTNRLFASHYIFQAPENGIPAAVGLNCGSYSVHDGFSLFSKLMQNLMTQVGKPEQYFEMSPVRHINESFPPAFVMTSSGDFLKDDAILLHKRLDKLGVENEYHFYDNDTHNLPHVFHLDIRSEIAQKCNDEECSFFKAHMHK